MQNQQAEADKLFTTALKDARGGEVEFVVNQVLKAYGYGKASEKVASWIPTARPDDWQAYCQLGWLYDGDNNDSLAAQSFRKAAQVADSPQAKALANRGLARAYHRMEKLAEAEGAYLAVLEAMPNDAESMNDLAYLYTDQMNQPAKAIPYAQRAAAALPANGSVADTYGWALAKTGDLSQAERELDRSIQLGPATAASRYHLGWVYEQTKRLDLAEKQYKQAYEMLQAGTKDPLLGILREALDRVRAQMKVGER
jgi:tetratricopeptide (TPR) repeat protein